MASNVPTLPPSEVRQPTESDSAGAKNSQNSLAGGKLDEDELELHLWQRACFLDDGSSVRHKVDSLRLRLAHLQYCCTKE